MVPVVAQAPKGVLSLLSMILLEFSDQYFGFIVSNPCALRAFQTFPI